MDLREALTQIAEIRQQVAQTETFRGYRAAPVAASGVLAWVAAGVQAWQIPDPTQSLGIWLTLWMGAALCSLAITGVAMGLHSWHAPSPLSRTLTALAVAQFLPCIVAGGLLTAVLWLQDSESLWMLPGLWAILFSLGIFASYRLLPRATFLVAVWYLAAGVVCLAWARGDHAFSWWAMAIPFGVGQLVAAGILYWTLERPTLERPTLERPTLERPHGDS
ncbi:MAG: hypothetical protein L0Y71_16615 [Gemmataceae bacterium]|nr:hypothetical protein [Gemmataceae bacterium]